jgi:hypothetical protein
MTTQRNIKVRIYPGANPTTALYNAGAVKVYNAVSSKVRFECKKNFLL